MLLGFISVAKLEEEQSQTLSAALGQARTRWQKADLVTLSLWVSEQGRLGES